MSNSVEVGMRVLIVAADPLVRAGLAAALQDAPGLQVVGQLEPGPGLADEAALFAPDVVAWDLGWETEAPLELPDLPAPTVLLLAEGHAPRELWRSGLGGLVSREADSDRLTAALQAAAQGWVLLDQAFASQIAPGSPPAEPLVEPLTEREMDVLQLLAEGLSNRAIAHQLGISEHTVKFHVNGILGKLDAQSRTEAAMRAAALGLILI
ncbi:MAG: response regulator transcription factor [Anaerolineales bacterium]|jgi:DNA-binding NarL/FixJ family response regulator